MIPALLASAVLAFGGSHAAASGSLPILGFQSDGTPTSLIARDAAGLGSVGVDGLNLTGRPGAVSAPQPVDRAQLAAAHGAGLPAVLLVGNYSNQINDFSESLAYRTLRSPTAISTLATTLTGDVRSEGWDGISVDLESLWHRDAAGLVTLLADLRADLGPQASLTVCVSNMTSPTAYPANGYDLAGIARSVSQVVLMAYDQHGPWEKTPGPVGATPWVTRGLQALMTAVPASQVDLGVGGYGYVWGPHARHQVSDAGARALVARDGGHARWVPSVGEWTAQLRNGAVMWWSDARTLKRREALAAQFGLHGLAVWSLGLSDPIG
ncbi:MAG TPA: glycosyl hydrolase family 18 protein [Solirubrobacteraceae bacterium]|nr:glycosyl hydrolase family 18 protein [Solirubrobacteraceae bacterium]